jgi:hypothetical protein
VSVHVVWDETAAAEPLVREVVRQIAGYDPGPLHHTCPQCGGVDHGRPYVDAPLDVSIAHAGGITIVAVSDQGPVGIDLEAAADPDWVRKEAVGKAYGTGLLVEDPGDAWVVDLEVEGWVAALASLSGPAEVRAARRRTAKSGSGPEAPDR